ncbi:MAG TPA: transporter [Allosphingosinicella sp.]|nr:transporter [Allosphingosinicella sp.]
MRSFVILAAVAATPAAAQQKSVEVGGGVEYQQGDYGTGERIEILSVPARFKLQSGRVTLTANVPWQRIEGPGNAVGGGGLLGIIIDPTQPAARTVRQGLGDVRLGATYAVPRASLGGVGLAVSGQVKLPTASSAKGLGTGAIDYAVGAEVSTRVGDVVPFAAVGYTVPGDPDGYELRNGLSARAGAALGLSKSAELHVAYGYARNLSPRLADEQQISTGLSARVSKRLSIGVQGTAGLSDGSPDVGAGLSLGIRM